MPRVDLCVPFSEKDEAKKLGARWDAAHKVWFVPEGLAAAPFVRWLPVPDDEPSEVHITQPTSFDHPVVRYDPELPDDLFSPRRIASTQEIADCFWQDGRLFLLPVPKEDQDRILAAGAQQGGGGLFIGRGTNIDFAALNPFLPFVGKSIIMPRLGDLIPASSFGANLCNLLTRPSWDKLRQRTFAETDGRCEICGSTEHLECHEYWKYFEPLPLYLEKGACGVQKLARLMPLCAACHETYHLGLANVRGRFEIVRARLRAMNRWTEEEYADYGDFLDERSARRTECFWVLDFSELKESTLSVHDKWRLRQDGFLVCNTQTGTTETMILGIPWEHRGQSHALMDPVIAYYE